MIDRALPWAVEVRPEEVRALAWSFLYHFCLMAGYYILQPLRDEMGIATGSEDLPALFIASMVLMILINPVFSALVSRMPRSRFIPLVYRFFMANLLLFYGLLSTQPPERQARVAQAFFLWVGVFNLFAVSIFWGFLADLFDPGQGKRLFGFIGAGGTLGQLAGSAATAGFARLVGPLNLLLVSILLLEAAVFSVRMLSKLFKPDAGPSPPAGLPSGGAWSRDAFEGIELIAGSPYLLGSCLYMFLYTFTSSFLYFEKATVVGASLKDPAARTAFFAQLNLVVGFLTVAIQLFFTGKFLSRLGVSLALALVPLLTAVGFVGLGCFPALFVFAGFDAIRKSANYAVARPAREVLYTVVTREEKYKAKSFIDTFVYRGGDALAAAAFTLLTRLSLGFSGIAFSAVPFALVWLVNGLALGNSQKALAAAGERQQCTTSAR
ncbi:MAG: MFS transporter [Candidatus Wallbacteria bacterium]|nr:MFS transporter [Candidatus Wallbacteria bacterium]